MLENHNESPSINVGDSGSDSYDSCNEQNMCKCLDLEGVEGSFKNKKNSKNKYKKGKSKNKNKKKKKVKIVEKVKILKYIKKKIILLEKMLK